MDDELKNFMEETERAERQMRIAQLELQIADLQSQVAELRCIDTIFPDDIEAWLIGLEANLKKAEQKISADAESDIIEIMTTQLRIARKQLKRGDENNLKISVMTLRDNWDRLMGNIDLELHKRRSAEQTEKSQKAHAARWGSRDELNQMLKELALMRDDWGDLLPVAALWIPFYSELGSLELSPHENSCEKMKDTDRMTWNGNSEGMTYKTFRNNIGKIRGENK